MKILIPVDGSENSKLALDEVKRRKWDDGSSVKVIHVVEKLVQVTDMMGVNAELARDSHRDLVEKGRKLLDDAERLLKTADQAMEVASELIEASQFESPQEAIVSYAEQDGTDLIVMASLGFSLWKRLTVGSVSLAVIQHAPCSVQIVRQKRTEDQ
ncbi:MAG: universal stress protein [Pyrinomonadaceae bacterium]